MSRRFSLQILLPIEGYEEDKIYKSEDIDLREVYFNQKPDNVYYRRLKEKSVYASTKDIVEEDEVKQLEREHITETVYCNEFKSCSLSWFYTSVGDELVPEDIAIVDDELIQKASALLGYESEKALASGLAEVIEDDANGEDKFMASLILAKEIASCMNGRAVLMYD